MEDIVAVRGGLEPGRNGFWRVVSTGSTSMSGSGSGSGSGSMRGSGSGSGRDTLIAELRLPALRQATVRVLHPFSWDAKYRGLTVDELAIGAGRTLVSGPYAAADAAALGAGRDTDFELRDDDGTDMTRYLSRGEIAGVGDAVQDAAGWSTIAGVDPDGSPVALAIAIDYSGTTLTELTQEADGLLIRLLLPWQTFSPATPIEHPGSFVRAGEGAHDDAEAWLRELIRDTIPTRGAAGRVALPLAPPLIADTWGFGEDIDPSRVEAFFDVARDLGVEVVTVDKGWEEHLGDWVPRDGYGGVAGLARLAHDRGMALGLWVGAGNASPDSVVAREHPGWLTTWRGQRPLLSFRNHTLCLGHEPARDHVLERLDSLVRDGMDWLLHDFETIPRCDSAEHSHDAGAGEDAAVRGWYSILAELRRRHPALVIENCWNGGRPLDLQMIAHHDTTIGDDWCKSGYNRVAKLGLGRYLPSSWCTAYMSDEDLPARAQLAPYVVGGPWILMGDLPGWSGEHRALMESAIDVYRRWRTPDLDARVIAPRIDGDVDALATSPRQDGGQLIAVTVSAEQVGTSARWYPDAVGPMVVTDEWTGSESLLTAEEVAAGIPLDTSAPTGLLLSVRPGGTQ